MAEVNSSTGARRGSKSASAFRTISEVAGDLEVPQHVLRFWESKFNQIRPLKRGGGRRYYRPEDVELLRAIQHFLYTEGYTIKGVQKLLKAHGARALASAAKQEGHAVGPPVDETGADETGVLDPQAQERLTSLLTELTGIARMLRATG